MYPVDIQYTHLLFLVICSMMWGVMCYKLCTPGAFFFLSLFILALTSWAVTGTIRGFSQLSLWRSILFFSCSSSIYWLVLYSAISSFFSSKFMLSSGCILKISWQYCLKTSSLLLGSILILLFWFLINFFLFAHYLWVF